MELWESYFSAVRSASWKRAIEVLDVIKEREPENPQVFLKLGDACQRLGDLKRAIPAYHQAAYLLLKNGFIQKALAVYKIILRLDPHDDEALRRLRELLVEMEAEKFMTLTPEKEIDRTEYTSMEEVRATPYEEETLLISGFLKDVPETEIKEIIPDLKRINFTSGETVIEEGDSGDSIYVINSGRAKVTTHVLGKVVELGILQRGDIFGEVAFLTGRPRTASVTAVEKLEVFEFTRPLLEKLLERYPGLLNILQDFYYSRLQNTLTKAKAARKS
ncbi:MAG: cyclic nucleotide-binding domain-containing protein [Thermodesulfovibrionales bacterium]|nr:cyclic nucleotide-binding domain-containing protein [Thermodesulfovibrionales bacterium]